MVGLTVARTDEKRSVCKHRAGAFVADLGLVFVAHEGCESLILFGLILSPDVFNLAV
jgi:hypothetical protein